MPATKDISIGFVGLGAMGFGMAANLVKEGYKVKGYDVFQKSIDRFEQAGGIAAKSLSDSASGVEYYICMVANAAQAQDALFDNMEAIVPALPKGATLLLTSTVPASYAQAVAEQLKSIGRSDIYFIDCPVSGGAIRAANGTLTIMAGASEDAMENGKSLLQVMSDQNKLFIVAGGVGQGSNMKMVHQVLAGIQILASSEAMGFAARLGLDAQEVRQRIIDSQAWSWMWENRTTRMLGEDYFPGVSALTIILKDVGIITSQARLRGFPTPLISVAEQAFLTGLRLGWATHDDASMVRLYFPEPVKSVQPANAADREAKIILVIKLLECIHIAAAAEAIAFSYSLGIDLGQFFELAVDAAGGSAMFRDRGGKMIRRVAPKSTSSTVAVPAVVENESQQKGGETINDRVEDLRQVMQIAQDLRCPLFLGSQAWTLYMASKSRGSGAMSDDSIIQSWAI